MTRCARQTPRMTARAQTHIILLIRVRYRTIIVRYYTEQFSELTFGVKQATTHTGCCFCYARTRHCRRPPTSSSGISRRVICPSPSRGGPTASRSPRRRCRAWSPARRCAYRAHISCAYIVRIDGVVHGVPRTGAAVACRRARRRVARIEQSSSQMTPAQPRMQAQEKAIDDNGSDP